jgi:solute carrier family 34 (sodium-dependent phosphate cotransporter)
MAESESGGVVYAPRALVEPEAAGPHYEAAIAQARRGTGRAAFAVAAGIRVAYVISALALFILALEILKAGAGGLKPVLENISADGTLGMLGFGWLGSYIVMSGSPVAAIALSLFGGGTISDTEAFAMINGSRLGASFIVLFVGFLYYVGRKRDPDSLYIGVVALLVAFTLWAPVVPVGQLILNEGWFDDVRFGSPDVLVSFVDVVYDPIVNRLKDNMHELALFALGIPALLAAFYIFDRALPNLDRPGPAFERFSQHAQRRLPMFLFGSAVTMITMSVSLSLTILVPLTLKGYVKRQHIIPYVMGANIATWIDTLFASLLLDTPRAFTIVFTEMVVGAAISLVVLLLLYEPYQRAILGIARRTTASRQGFAIFLAAILVMPVVLLLL